MKKGVEASNIEIEMEDYEECTITLSLFFLIISGINLFYSAHSGKEF